MKKIEIGDVVMVDNEFRCEVITIFTEDNVKLYECKPLEFDSFTRFLTIDRLEKEEKEDE